MFEKLKANFDIKSGLSISQFWSLILLSEFLALSIGFLIGGWSILFNFESLVYSFFIMSSLILVSSFSSRDEPVATVLTFYTSVFVFSRLLCYLLIPIEIYFPYPQLFTVLEINKCLQYLFIGNMFILAGSKIGFFLYKKYHSEFPKFKLAKLINIEPYFCPVVVLALFFVLLELYLTYALGVNFESVVSEKRSNHTLIMIIRTLTGFDAYFLFFLGLIFTSNMKRKRTLYCFIAFMYWITLSIGGSKGGLFRLDVIFILTCSAVLLKEKIGIRYFVLAIIVNFIIAVPVFLAMQKVRDFGFNKFAIMSVFKPKKMKSMSSSQTSHFNLYSDIKKSDRWQKIRATEFYQGKVLPSVRHFVMLLNRLGILDYIVIVMNKGNLEKAKEVYSFNYLFKSLYNILTPGNFFKEAEFKTERMLPYVFNYQKRDYIRKNFNTEPLTIWGASYVYFGISWGLVSMSVFGFLTQTIFSFLKNSKVIGVRALGIMFLPICVYGGIGNFGLDSFLSLNIFILLQLAIIIIIYKNLTNFFHFLGRVIIRK
jgi:hypothetical protein